VRGQKIAELHHRDASVGLSMAAPAGRNRDRVLEQVSFPADGPPRGLRFRDGIGFRLALLERADDGCREPIAV